MATKNMIEAAAQILSKAPKAPRGQQFANIQGWTQNAIYRACRAAGMEVFEAASISILHRVGRRAEEIR